MPPANDTTTEQTDATPTGEERVIVRFKRSVACPQHLTRLGRKPTKAERKKLAAGAIPQRRFHGGRQYTMTRADLSRYCLKEKLDYRVERVIPAPAPAEEPAPNPETPDGPQPPGETAADPPAETGEPTAAPGEGAQPPADEQPAGDGPSDPAGAAEQPAAVDEPAAGSD